MAKSPQLRKLAKRFTYLRKTFLPIRFRTATQYTDDQIEKARAFCILFYSEVEHYLESLAKSILDETKSQFSSGLSPLEIQYILSTKEKAKSFPKGAAEIKGKRFQKRIIEESFYEFEQIIYKNAGAKDYNLLRLLLPLGLNETAVDPMLFTVLNTFAAERGDIAHKPINKVTKILDPREEYERGITLLNLFDEMEGCLI